MQKSWFIFPKTNDKQETLRLRSEEVNTKYLSTIQSTFHTIMLKQAFSLAWLDSEVKIMVVKSKYSL